MVPFGPAHAGTIARQLLNRFGSISRIVAASDTQLREACPDFETTVALMTAARSIVMAGLHDAVARARVDPEDPALTEYLTAKFIGQPHEQLYAIYLDRDDGFLAEDLISTGAADNVGTRIAPIIRRAIELGAQRIVLVHNHPSKSPDPSVEDIRATHQIMAIAKAMEIEIADHLIVAGTTVTSMRRLNLL